jgi:hypothetical protein
MQQVQDVAEMVPYKSLPSSCSGLISNSGSNTGNVLFVEKVRDLPT